MALNSFTPTSLGGAWHKVSNFVGKMSKVICDLAHCWLLCSVCPHLDASVKVGLTECRKLSKLASW